MNDRPHLPLIGLAAVERDTGISKETLRIWERRYGFPAPERNARGERLYSSEQLEKLKVLRQLIDLGHRPGKIAKLSLAELCCLMQESRPAMPARAGNGDVADLLALLRAHRIDALRLSMSTLLVRYGLKRFVVELAAPLTVLVGEAWASGEIEVFEEHLGNLLRRATGALSLPHSPDRSRTERPSVLLTTLPQERHGLGLLMVEALLTLHGCTCLSLGVELPRLQIVHAARTQRADVVGLSFSSQTGNKHLVDGLVELRQTLPERIEIWVGGTSPALAQRLPPGIRVVRELSQLAAEVTAWRKRHRVPG